MSLLVITLTSTDTKSIVNFFSALNCAQMEINEFASIETTDDQNLDAVFEDLTELQREKVLEMFNICNAPYTCIIE